MRKKEPLILSEIYVVRLFNWEGTDDYASWLFFSFEEGWEMFTETIEDIGAIFTGGMVTPEGHYYLAQTEEQCLQLCPFFYNEYENEAEEL